MLGTFLKTFVVDGEGYELYGTVGDEATTYDLVRDGEVIWAGLVKLPDAETVTGLVRAVRALEGGSAQQSEPQ